MILVHLSKLKTNQVGNNKEEFRRINKTNKRDFMDIFQTVCPSNSKYVFFYKAYRIFTKINNILDHKESLHKFHKGKAIQIIFSDYNAIKLEIYYRNKRALTVENV